ncbi:MAG: 2-(1,2-epoxy-1,2-dihydrophenyl)acetyl-CoA isomerase [Rhodothermales bacterium]|nr:2-(1,2-epoxy-1,2-dihydrophenyl)acetyl-CoA isomerase [Rhodothermales bacterium]
MSFQFIDLQIAEAVAIITLNRPDVLNSFNEGMSVELVQALDSASDASVRSVVLTGAGRAFCAGQDLSEVVPAPGEEPPPLGPIVERCYNPVIRAIRGLEKPVIAAVNGVAAGAGANMALACDFVIASEKASFIQSFCHVGLIPDSGGTFFLPRIVGLARATELMMLGEKVRADRAYEMGMIYRVAPAEKLLDEATSLAERLASMPTRGLGLTKRGLNASFVNSLDAQLEFEIGLQDEAGRTEDYNEGVNAFLQKRDPTFTGR